MNIISAVTDNITDVLVKVLEFTGGRQKLLTRNINNVRSPGFVPKDLPVDDFCRMLNHALEQHVATGRLVLCDTQNLKFGAEGSFWAEPVVDENAAVILQDNPDRYLELQMNKLLENALNHRIAAELLKMKQGMLSIFSR